MPTHSCARYRGLPAPLLRPGRPVQVAAAGV